MLEFESFEAHQFGWIPEFSEFLVNFRGFYFLAGAYCSIDVSSIF